MIYSAHPYALTPSVKWIMIVTAVVFMLQIIPGVGSIVDKWGSLQPSLVLHGELWRLATYALLHDTFSPFHILFNMLTVWMFGVELERLWGTRRFIAFYSICAIGSGVISLGMVFLGDPWIIGASGAVLALLTAYAIAFPDRQILLFMLFPVPVRIAVVIFGAVALLGTMGSSGNVAHLTHLGGIIAALLFFRLEPLVVRERARVAAYSARVEMDKRMAQKSDRDRYWNEIVDPLLKKVSQQGEASLTKEERRLLAEASKKKGDGGNVVQGRFGSRR